MPLNQEVFGRSSGSLSKDHEAIRQLIRAFLLFQDHEA